MCSLRWRLLLVVSVLTFWGFRASPAQEHQGEVQGEISLAKKLESRVESFDSAGRPLVDRLLDLAYRYSLPLGLEYVDREALTRPLTLKIRSKSLGETLQALVGQVPKYQISFSRRIVQVYSPKARADSSNLLNTVINDFKVEGLGAYDADYQLYGALSAKLYPDRGFGGSFVVGSLENKKVTLHLRKARVYEILDDIVAETGNAIWTVKVPPEKLSTFETRLWHIYGLDLAYKAGVLEDLRSLFPPEKKQSS